MNNTLLRVVLQRCSRYERSTICGLVDEAVSGLGFNHNFNGAVVLLKPNLISGSGVSLSCTHREFIAGVAVWFLDQGAKVHIGDSPAIGSGASVCEKRGITEALAGMGVKQVDFTDSVRKTLAGGVSVNIARAPLECDFFVNLAKVKAHKQMYVTLSVKNIFGIVRGMKKAMLHMSHGDSHKQFSEIILDLVELLPPSLHLADGIVAMHRSGPLDGNPLQLNCVGGATCPVALDTALLELLELEKNKSPLWRVARERKLAGSDPGKIHFPLLSPADFSGGEFGAPEILHSIRFNPFGFLSGMAKRVLSFRR
jgi:uncharacterized protein (DUF362 family)